MFQISALPESAFQHLYGLSDADLTARGVQVHISDGAFPCRVSLADAKEGARVLLLNHEHQPADTPYRSRHAIFVEDGARTARPGPGEIPASIAGRLLSVRAFDRGHEMIDADVCEGRDLVPLLARFFAEAQVDYIHLHYARRGCYAACVWRPGAEADPASDIFLESNGSAI